MGIFLGDSIYNNGGGGGGYKDGGELVDADFIKVENNTVNTFENESRDNVNFYFEVKDGEAINSIIEIESQVNTVVNVYTVKNGLYYSLGCIGSNSVNAGDKYKITVIGDTFVIEQITVSGTPEFVNIDNVIYGIVKLGNLYWTKKNLCTSKFNPYVVGYDHYFRDPNIHYDNGWRLPTKNEVIALKNNYSLDGLKSVSGWANQNGNNATGFNLMPKGWYNYSWHDVYNLNYAGSIMYKDVSNFGYAYATTEWTFVENTDAYGRLTDGVTVRLVNDSIV